MRKINNSPLLEGWLRSRRGVLVLLFLLIVSCNAGKYEEPEKLEIEMLDVGQGLSFLIKGKNCNTLYDTGTPNSGIDTMLANRNITDLCTVILSHNHNDHTGGVPLLKNVNVKRTLTAKDISRGDTLADFLPWTARVLFPLEPTDTGENENSIAIRISDGMDSFLFTGDLEEEQEEILLEQEPNLEITALQIGHHGSNTSSSWDFLSKIQPKMAFISAGKDNSYGHPRPETLSKLKILMQQDSTKIYQTAKEGSVKAEWIYKTGIFSLQR